MSSEPPMTKQVLDQFRRFFTNYIMVGKGYVKCLCKSEDKEPNQACQYHKNPNGLSEIAEQSKAKTKELRARGFPLAPRALTTGEQELLAQMLVDASQDLAKARAEQVKAMSKPKPD